MIFLKTAALRRRSTLMMLACASLWSIAGLFIKKIPWNPFVIAGFRSLIAACMMVVFVLLTKRKFRLTRSTWITAVLSCGTFLAFVVATKLTTAANAIMIQFTNPVFIMLFSVLFLKQRLRKVDIIAVACTLGGIVLFFFDQITPGNLAGNLIALLSGLLIAGMYISVGRVDEVSRMSGMLMGHVLTALVGIPFVFFTENVFTKEAVLNLVILGVFQLGIPNTLLVLASKHCPPLACSLISSVEPILSPVWVALFGGERPGVFALCGGVVVIVSITLWCVRNGLQAGRAEERAVDAGPQKDGS